MYIVEYKENNVVIGYLNAKRSRKAKPIVTDIKQATRLPYARALDAAGRYNGMHAGTGKAAHVIVAPADTDPFRHYMRRAGRPLGTADLETCTCDVAAGRAARAAAARNATNEDEYLAAAESTWEQYVEPCAHCRTQQQADAEGDALALCDGLTEGRTVRRAVVDIGPRTCADCGRGVEWCRCP